MFSRWTSGIQKAGLRGLKPCWCNKYTYRAHVFLMRSLSAFLSQYLAKVCSRGSSHLARVIPRTRVAQAQHEAWNIVSFPKVFTSPRAMSYVTSLMSDTPSHGTRTPSLTVIRPTSISSFSCDPRPGEIQPCADLRQLERGSLAEPQPLQVVSPSILPKTRILRNTRNHYSSTDRV